MPKTIKKLSRIAKQNKAERKQKELEENRKQIVNNISCKSISVSEEIKKCNLIKEIFKKFTWKNLSVMIIYHNDKDLGVLTKIEVNASYLLSQDTITFIPDENKYSPISEICADAYGHSFRIGSIKDNKDRIFIQNFLYSEIRKKRKGIESEYRVFNTLKELLPEEFSLRFDNDLDALSIDFWAQYLDTEAGILFQVKSSDRFIQKSIKKYKEKKHRLDLENNRYWSLLQSNNELYYLIVQDDNIFVLDENFNKHNFMKYIPLLLKKFKIKKIA